MEGIDAAPSGTAENDLASAMDELTQPGPFLALSSGDAGANNYLIAGGEGRLIDFEARPAIGMRWRTPSVCTSRDHTGSR